MTKKKVYQYHIFPPFIDAYETSGMNPDNRKTLEEIKELMKSHTIIWGAESIGEAVGRTGDVLRHNGKLVIGCAYVWDDVITGKFNKSYLVLSGGYEDGKTWWENVEIVEGVIKKSWDVT